MYCKEELEGGGIVAFGMGNPPVALVEWHSDERLASKGLIKKGKVVPIKPEKNAYYGEAYYCQQCNKVYGEFATI